MGVLKRREEPTETMTLRLPASVKAEIDRLRERAGEAGFDLNATIAHLDTTFDRVRRLVPKEEPVHV